MCFWKSKGVAAKLLKGAIVELSGRLYVRAYIGADNEPKASPNLHCNNIKAHGKTAKKDAENEGNVKEKLPIENIVSITEPMDDMPF